MNVGYKKNIVMATFAVLLTFIMSISTIAKAATSKDMVYGDDHTLTRAEWMHDLVLLFEMQKDKNLYPDLYYPDLTESTDYYSDIMTAIGYGVVDLEAGSDFEPEGEVTRDFAVTTLNYCLGFVDNYDSYTFSDEDDVTDKGACQTAIEREWVSLVAGKFDPERIVTTDEIKKMCEDARTLVAETQIVASYDNKYTFEDDVIVVPKETEVEVDGNKITIHDDSVSIAKNDIFVIYVNDIAVTYTAKTINNINDGITVTAEEAEEGIAEVDAQGEVDADADDFIPADGVEYTITEEEITSKNAPDGNNNESYASDDIIEDTIDSKLASGEKKLNKVLKFDKIPVPGTGEMVQVGIVVSNVTIKYNFNTPQQKATMIASADVKSTVKVNTKKNFTAPLGSFNVGGIGSVALEAYVKVDGSIQVTFNNHAEFGVSYEGSSFRVVQSFTNINQPHLTADFSVDTGLKLSASLNKSIPVLSASAYARIGIVNKVQVEEYGDNKTPFVCQHRASFLYADSGASASVDFKVVKKTLADKTWVYWGPDNSPARSVMHIEDGQLVPQCTRNPDKYKNFFSKWNSWYGGYGWYGLDDAGEIVPVFTYTLDDDGNATITGYTGRASILNIPEEVDGHTVVAIGDNAFKKRTDLNSVIFPDTVTSIGKSSFIDCTNIYSIDLPNTIVTIGEKAFYNCASLQNVEIPDTVENLGSYSFSKCSSMASANIPNNKKYTLIGEGIFADDVSLNNVLFSEYITEIGKKSFYNCGFVSLDLNDNITKIGQEAFYGCKNLNLLTLPKYFETFGGACFGDCDSLTTINLPRYLSKEENFHYYVDNATQRGMFYECDNLKTITFEKGITRIPSCLLSGCSGIEEITIPDTVTVIGSHAFNRCTLLSKINLPESLTKIEVMAFRGCKSLEKISIPNSVTEIDSCAFISAGLKDVVLPRNLKKIGTHAFSNNEVLESVAIPKGITEIVYYYDGGPTYTTDGPFTECPKLTEVSFDEKIEILPARLFQNCNGILNITIPDSVKTIEDRVFAGAKNLADVKLSSSLTSIGSYVFLNCTSLEKIVIPDSVNSMGSNMFEGCSLLSDVTLPKYRIGVTSGMFKNCTSLKTMKFPDSLKYIYGSAFEGCENLETITLPDGFMGIENNAFKDCKKMTHIDIKGYYIGKNAFENCLELNDINMSDTINSIGTSAFLNCKSLESIHLSTCLNEIAANTFEGCTYLNDILIPYGVVKIGGEAFKNCTKLTKITILKKVASIADNAFSYPEEVTIYGVKGSYAEEYASKNSIGFEALSSNVESVELQNDEYTVTVGKKITIPIVISPEKCIDDIVWETSDSNIAKIVADGVVQGMKSGSCSVTVTAGGIQKECKIIVKDTHRGFNLSANEELKVGDSLTIKCVDSDKNAVNANELRWWSRDNNIATVDQKGNVKGLKPGTVEIEAWLLEDTDKKASIKINIVSEYTEGKEPSSGDDPSDGDDSGKQSGENQGGGQGIPQTEDQGGGDEQGVSQSSGGNQQPTTPSGSTQQTAGDQSSAGQTQQQLSGEQTSTGQTQQQSGNTTSTGQTTTPQSGENNVVPPVPASTIAKVSKVTAKNKKGKKLIVTWKWQDDVDKYEIQYALNKKFTKSKKSKKVGGYNDSVTIKKLKKGKTYYIRVRAGKKESGAMSYSEWSAVKKVKIKK